MLAFGEVVVVIATLKKLLYIHVSFSIFAKFADYTFFFSSLLFCYFVILAILAIVIWVFNCCNEISCYFCDFLGFCKQFLLNIFLLKLSRQKSVRKNLLQFAILIEFVIFAIVAIFSIHFLTVRLISLKKLRKQFATKFLQQCSILDIRGEPQGSFTQLFQSF